VLSSGFGTAPAFGGTGADKIALHIRQPAENGDHQAPGAGAGAAHGSASDRNRTSASTMRFTMPNRSKVLRTSQSMRVTITTSPGLRWPSKHTEKLAPVGACARHLLAVDVPITAPGGAQLIKLRVEGLPVGADTGVADKAFFGISSGHILRQR
jgi:hypothetical protein